MFFTEAEYEFIHELVFQPDYPGYKPTVVEIPNGDGKSDTDKKYAHIASKYFKTTTQQKCLQGYLNEAHDFAMVAAKDAGFPKHLMPDLRYGALRVLDYPPGAVANAHRDFDCFTLMLYRDQPDKFVAHDEAHPLPDTGGNTLDLVKVQPLDIIRGYNRQAHLGEIAEIEGFGSATLHEVLPSETRQHSIVYFAIPDHDSVLKNGQKVRDWLNDRMQRSRSEFKKYE